jgi:NADPH2:quinone reductase
MKAIRVEEWGGPEVLRAVEVPDPALEAGQILVRLHAAGVNPVETYIRAGTYAKLPTLPYTPGQDGAGVIETVSPNVPGLAPGQRVYLSGSLTGTYAEKCLCSPDQVHLLPDSVSFGEGAALGIPFATAYRALVQRAGAKKGDTVLVHGGTGGVGLAAVQFARQLGCRVLATGGTETGRVLLIEQGAESAFDHHEMGYIDQVLAQTGGRGVDVVLEMLANVNLGNDLRMLAKHGRVVVVGSRGTVEINPRDLMSRDADIRGLVLFNAAPDELREIYAAISHGLAEGFLKPIVGAQFPLENAANAHEQVLAPGAHGKVILEIP